MAVTSRRSSRRLTFTVLAAGAGFFAMLQSLITPVLPTIQQDLHTSQNTVTWVLTAYLLSRVDLHADPRTGRRHDRQGADAGRLARRARPRLPGGRHRPEHRRPHRRPGRAGHRRRGLPAVVRHHPRRVPGRAGLHRGGRHLGDRRRRRRAGHRAGRPDRQHAGLPLAVLDPDGRGRADRRGRAPVRARVAGPYPRTHRLARHRCCSPAGWSRCCCRSARAPPGAGPPPGCSACWRSPWCCWSAGWSPRCARPTR